MNCLTALCLMVLGFEEDTASSSFYKDQIAVSRWTEGYWQIWSLDEKGQNGRQLTFDSLDKRHPCWSPDGEFVYYCSSSGQLFRVPRSGGEARVSLGQLAPIAEPTISTQGKIAFTRVLVQPRFGSTVSVWVSDLEGKEAQELTQTPTRASQPAWSSDGRRLAWIEFDPALQLYRLIVAELASNQRTVVLAAKQRMTTLAWSEESTQIAFAQENHGNLDLWLVDLEDSELHRLNDHPALDLSPAFVSQEASILFVSNRGGDFQLWLNSSLDTNAPARRFADFPVRGFSWFREQSKGSLQLSELLLSRDHFDPSNNESVELSFQVDRNCEALCEIRDRYLRVVRRLRSQGRLQPGKHRFTWDGKDEQGNKISAGAYFFRLKVWSEEGVVYWDPIPGSGGEELFPTKLKLDPSTKSVFFENPATAAIRLRFGLRDGSYWDSQDWFAHSKGVAEIPYEGFSIPGAGEFWDREDRQVWCVAYALPRASVIVNPGSSAPVRGDWNLAYWSSVRNLNDHHFHASSRCRDSRLQISLLEDEASIALGKKATVQIQVQDSKNGKVFESSLFWVGIYADGVLLLEDEDFVLPARYEFDLSRFPNGEHSFLINLGSSEDHLASGFVSFRVQRKDQ